MRRDKLKDVFLAEFGYPCVAYIIRRIGMLCDVEHVLAMQGERYSYATKLKIGDVVVWERNDGPNVSDATLSIGRSGTVTTKLRLGKHFGVYEGNGMVSDITFDSENYFPHIRLMPLSDHPVPKLVLRYKNLQSVVA